MSDAAAAVARYQQVAVDIASRIVDKQYHEGERIYARSSIASQYSVSSETARRAIALLSAHGIVETAKGSGVVIRSKEKALEFVQRYRQAETLAELKRTALRQSEALLRESAALKETIAQITDRADRLRFINPFAPFEVMVEEAAFCAGKTITQLQFWQNTGATIVAVRRGETLSLSPGPSEVLLPGDVIYFICKEAEHGRAREFVTTGVSL